MNTTINPKSVTLTPDDIHILYYIGEDMDDAQDNMIKCDAIADIFSEATARLDETGRLPRQGVFQSVANVICDYSRKANDAMEDVYQRFHDFYTQKRDESYGEAGGNNE